MEKGAEGGRGRTLGRGGQSLQQDAQKGLYMGRHVGCFFSFFIALSKKEVGVYSSGMAYAADRSQLLSKTQDVFASQSERSILGLRLTSPAQPAMG